MIYSHEVKMMCPVARGVNNGTHRNMSYYVN